MDIKEIVMALLGDPGASLQNLAVEDPFAGQSIRGAPADWEMFGPLLMEVLKRRFGGGGRSMPVEYGGQFEEPSLEPEAARDTSQVLRDIISPSQPPPNIAPR